LDVINEITRLKRVVYFLQRRLTGSATGGGTTVITSGVQSIVEGANITVNDSDHQNPIVSASFPILDFDFNYFFYIFTDPISYNLYINEMELGSFTAPSPFDVEMGTF
jgi:hypothetical protein